MTETVEQKAEAMYRAKFPGGTPWQELADTTRLMWVNFAAKHTAAALNEVERAYREATS